jgi:quercetin dioxygenase-like cupin family protein
MSEKAAPPSVRRAEEIEYEAVEEYTVGAGDSVHIPAGAVHWYRNDGDRAAAFICAVPAGDDEITLVE